MKTPAKPNARREESVDLTLVFPLFNEAEVLPLLFQRLDEVFSKRNLKEKKVASVRYLFVDDGSRDASAQMVKDYIDRGAPATLVRLTRNFGHQNALSAGLELARGHVVATLDADLQDPPEVIYQMLETWRRGADVVSAQRRKRKEGALLRFCYSSFYRLLAMLSEVEITLDSGDFCLMDRQVVQALNRLPEKLRFPRGLRSWVGYRHVPVEYERARRQAGYSKYGWRKLYRLATEGVASLSTRPLKFLQFFSLGFGLLFVGLSAVLLYDMLAHGVSARDLAAQVALCLLSLGFFVVLLSINVLSGYVGRIYLEVKGRPVFLVLETYGAEAEDRRRAA